MLHSLIRNNKELLLPAEKTKMKETVCAFKVLSSVVEEVCGSVEEGTPNRHGGG